MNNRICDCPDFIKANCHCSGCGEKVFKCFHRYNMIMASAGTGKTYNLANRYIQLISYGIEPSEILAITFARKATAEIFDKIINRLLELLKNTAASNAGECSALCKSVTKEKMAEILQKLLVSNGELRISTIDSFFSSLLKAYAPELGLPAETTMVDNDDDRPKRKVLRHWLSRATAEEREELRELLKECSRNEQVIFEKTLLEIIQTNYSNYLKCLYSENKDIPWGKEFDFEKELYPTDREKLTALADEIIAFLPDYQNKTLEERCTELAKHIKNVERGKISPSILRLFKENFFKNNSENWLWERGTELIYTKSKIFTPEHADLIRDAASALLHLELERCHAKTKAVFTLTKKFDEIYTREVRNKGILTFDDQPMLLRNSEEDGIFHLSYNENMNMEERLDSIINHYLFDEFQDTSRSQWYIFENLISEILNPYDRFRSLFCVGDIKQSIYQWRGGAPELFGEVIEKTAPAARVLGYEPCETLVKSYRSSKDILETVNRVFETVEKTPALLRSCIEKMGFKEHTSEFSFPGFSALINTNGATKDALTAMQSETILGVLNQINPFNRAKKLTVGVLCRTNVTATTISDALRALDGNIPISIDGCIAPQNSMAYVVMKQMVTLSEHPGDKYAKGFFSMLSGSRADGYQRITPADIAKKMQYSRDDEVTLSQLAAAIRKDIFEHGLAGFIQHYLDVFEDVFSDFDYERVDAARTLAESFTGSSDEFFSAIENWNRKKDQSVANTVQFMTIHKSKGLEFDIVFLPDVKSTPFTANNKLNIQNGEWINYFPQKEICCLVPEFTAYAEEKDRNRLYEDCCTYYVAMTRAKRAMYIFADSKNGLSPDEKHPLINDIISDRLSSYGMVNQAPELEHILETSQCEKPGTLSYASGKEDWYTDNAETVEVQEKPAAVSVTFVPSARKKVLASGQHDAHFTIDPSLRFVPKTAAQSGTALHELFEKIEYVGKDFNPSDVPGAGELDEDIRELFEKSLAEGSEIRAILARPDTPHILWKERRFLLKDDSGAIIPGAFDRVVLYCGKEGKPVSADILDYKSDRVEKAEELISRHHLQLKLYRKCLAKMTGIPEEKIRLQIAALRFGRVLEVK